MRRPQLALLLLVPIVSLLGGADDCTIASPTDHDIRVGPGFSDVSPHQIVRTSGDVLYTVAATCDDYPECPNSSIRVYKGNQPGTPTSFVEVGASGAPGGGVGSPAVGIDGSDKIHVIWLKVSGTAKYATFDTATDSWSSTESLGTTGWTDFLQGEEGAALAIDASGIPHAVWNTRTGINNRLRLKYARRTASGWTAAVDVADVVDCNPASDYCNAWHPTLAFSPTGELYLSWLNGTYDYVPDGRVRVRKRNLAGNWEASVAITDAAQSGIDQGPSMIVSPDATVHLTFLNTSNRIRYWYNEGQGWKGDQQPANQQTHDPALGPDNAGGVFIYGHGTPQGGIGGHGDNMYSFHKPFDGSWGPWTLYQTGSIDSSVSTRWSGFFHNSPQNVDILYWADAYPNVLHVGVN